MALNIYFFPAELIFATTQFFAPAMKIIARQVARLFADALPRSALAHTNLFDAINYLTEHGHAEIAVAQIILRSGLIQRRLLCDHAFVAAAQPPTQQ
jgi:hypothetical protein